MARTLTSANCAIAIRVPLVFPTAFRLENFSADDIYDTNDVDTVELVMGADGRLSAGWIANVIEQRFTFKADSTTLDKIDDWYMAERQAREKFPATGSINIPSIQKKFAMQRGFLMRYKPMPDAKRILQSVSFSIGWQTVSPALTP